ncbi:chorismate-binding protein [Spirochaeta lutea]|uniref:chorismate-binding protein n=1 Tax=Spirochaeta lutea TaxID=1480694 RepID=UPI00068A1D28|nr:chorismate-binding protein [Spirochaeta lutea]
MVVGSKEEARIYLNALGRGDRPFFFLSDFHATRWFICPLDSLKDWKVRAELQLETGPLSLGGAPASPGQPRNAPEAPGIRITSKTPLDFRQYSRGFEIVQDHLRRGNSFLVNLTYPTPITLSGASRPLDALVRQSGAPCRLTVGDLRISSRSFSVFSPERFVTIRGNRISSFPMKGTRRIPGPGADPQITDPDTLRCSALGSLMTSPKEQAEHRTVVDLIRNDLGISAHRVWVDSYRFSQVIRTGDSELVTTSSRICGALEEGWSARAGDILTSQLPAGSVSGAPKAKTLEIIRAAELDDRGFYCGVAGVWLPPDRGAGRRSGPGGGLAPAEGEGTGPSLESWVLIRYIEQVGDAYAFRSGGGITIYSDVWEEYRELVDKIAIPVS